MTGEPVSALGKPVCPIHRWTQLKHNPKDDIAPWICPKCNWMATEEFIRDMTPEKMKQMKEEHERSVQFRIDSSARREVSRINFQMKRIETNNKEEAKEGVQQRKLNKVKAITDFT